MFSLTILSSVYFFFFFNDTATTDIYTLSLHDALPISQSFPLRIIGRRSLRMRMASSSNRSTRYANPSWSCLRSEEHTSELQSLAYLVCRLLLEKKKKRSVWSYSSRLLRVPYSETIRLC